jgi:hypothetical protein
VFGPNLRNKILSTYWVAPPDEALKSVVNRCHKCNHTNKFENKYCEKCSVPITNEALDEIKKQEESKMTP